MSKQVYEKTFLAVGFSDSGVRGGNIQWVSEGNDRNENAVIIAAVFSMYECSLMMK